MPNVGHTPNGEIVLMPGETRDTIFTNTDATLFRTALTGLQSGEQPSGDVLQRLEVLVGADRIQAKYFAAKLGAIPVSDEIRQSYPGQF